jgi:cytochrome b561
VAASAKRYTAVAIVLHWAIAIAIFGLIALGWWMGDALESPDTQAQAIAAFQLHKSLGLTVLTLSVLRLAWRLINPAPPPPEGMKAWERLVATATHAAFYLLIIAMPLSGWLFVSAGWSVHDQRPLEVPTVYFGMFEVPHLLGLSALPDGIRATAAAILEFGHSKLAWVAIVLTILHVGAALKHQFADKDGVLGRMVPGAPDGVDAPAPIARTAALAAGFIAIAIAAGASVWAFSNPPAGAPAAVVHTHSDDEAASPPDAEQARDAVAVPADPDAPPVWRVNSAASSIVFTGAHAGVPFEGRFSRWHADIRFDPGNLDQSKAVVTVETASAADGVPVHDSTLPRAEWFDVEDHPTADFSTTSFRASGNGVYEARGTLSIKGRAIETRLPFTLRIEGNRAVMDGTAQISRADANLGMRSDPEAEYVSAEIGVRVHVEAVRAQ